ncbi:hypothetical protein U1Q18_018749, partial [Sarracenia purpurea var. burkii]
GSRVWVGEIKAAGKGRFWIGEANSSHVLVWVGEIKAAGKGRFWVGEANSSRGLLLMEGRRRCVAAAEQWRRRSGGLWRRVW